MTLWLLIVTFVGAADAKMSPFGTEAECKAAMASTVRALKSSKKVERVECVESAVTEEHNESSKSDAYL